MHVHKLNYNEQKRDQLFKKGKLTKRPQLRKIIFKRDGHKCSSCNLTEWLNQPIPLWLDHIDGNASNNKPDNLRLMCLNCDAQGSTFGNKNKGKGRRSLGLKPWA
jgi:5-methylcytosine-specific restriction endonuclease McrA